MTEGANDVASSATQTVEQTVQEATPTVEQTVQEATKAPAPVIDRATDAASSATQTVEQTVWDTKQTVEQTVQNTKQAVEQTARDTKQTVAQTVRDTKQTVEQTVREATKAPAPVIDRAKDAASSAAQTVEQTVRETKETVEETVGEATATSSQPVGPDTDDEPGGAVPGPSGTAVVASDSDRDNRRAGVSSNSRPDDDLSGTTRAHSIGTKAGGAPGSAAPMSNQGASAVGSRVAKEVAAAGSRRTETRHSGGARRSPDLTSGPSNGGRADLVAPEPRSTTSGTQQSSSENEANGGLFSFSLPGFSWPSILPSPITLARWLLYATMVLLAGIAVLIASGFWARHQVLKF